MLTNTPPPDALVITKTPARGFDRFSLRLTLEGRDLGTIEYAVRCGGLRLVTYIPLALRKMSPALREMATWNDGFLDAPTVSEVLTALRDALPKQPVALPPEPVFQSREAFNRWFETLTDAQQTEWARQVARQVDRLDARRQAASKAASK